MDKCDSRCVDDLTVSELQIFNSAIATMDELYAEYGESNLQSPYSGYVYHALLQDYLHPVSHSVLNDALPKEELVSRLVKSLASIIIWLDAIKDKAQSGSSMV